MLLPVPASSFTDVIDVLIGHLLRLNEVPAERLEDLRRKGVLGAAYCQLVSMNNWPKRCRLA